MAEERVQRRLAAILAADAVGYSRLMESDEEGTLARFTGHRDALIVPSIAAHHGRLFKTTGDGFLAEFASVVDAVACAAAIQAGMARRNAELAENQRIDFRIGVNLGDVIVAGDDLYGDGVNVAARLEGIAPPGGLCVSGNAYEMVEGKLALAFADAGSETVKNLSKPVRVYRLVTERDTGAVSASTAAAAPSARPPPVPDKPSIAVLPLVNMSGDAEQDYFADGITEDIITELARFQSIFVIARNSTFAYKGRSVRVQDVGREVGVRYVLEGSVRKAGPRVRVGVQLIEAETGNHVWAERYDRELTDIFELQDELTRTIVAALPGRLESADLERIRHKPPQDAGAYDYVLRAKLLHHRGTSEDNAEGLRLLEKAIGIDPEFAPAYAWRACTLGQAYMRGYLEPTRELEERIYRDVLKGLSIDENDLECVRILCEFRIEYKRLDEALALNDKGLRLNPNDPRIVAQRGEILTWAGRPEEGAQWVERAMRLDPYGADAFAHLLGRALFGMRRYADAIAAFGRAPALRYSHHAYMAACHAWLGNDAQAAAEAAEVLGLKPDFSAATFRGILFYADSADLAHVRDGLLKAGLPA